MRFLRLRLGGTGGGTGGETPHGTSHGTPHGTPPRLEAFADWQALAHAASGETAEGGASAVEPLSADPPLALEADTLLLVERGDGEGPLLDRRSLEGLRERLRFVAPEIAFGDQTLRLRFADGSERPLHDGYWEADPSVVAQRAFDPRVWLAYLPAPVTLPALDLHAVAEAAGAALCHTVVPLAEVRLDLDTAPDDDIAALQARFDFGLRRRRAPRATPPDAPVSLSLVIPTLDSPRYIVALVEAVLADPQAADPAAVEIVLVDNGSTDPETLAFYSRLHAEARDRVRLIYEKAAFNWSAMCNAGARAATREHVVFLNNDMMPRHGGWLATLTERLGQPGVGVVGARLLFEDGTLQHCGISRLGSSLFHDLRGRDPEAPIRRHLHPRRAGIERDVYAVTGAFLATPRALFHRVGGFRAERMKVAFSDVAYCQDVRRAGRRVLYTPDVEFYHYESKTRGYHPVDGEEFVAFFSDYPGVDYWRPLALTG